MYCLIQANRICAVSAPLLVLCGHSLAGFQPSGSVPRHSQAQRLLTTATEGRGPLRGTLRSRRQQKWGIGGVSHLNGLCIVVGWRAKLRAQTHAEANGTELKHTDEQQWAVSH